MRPASQRPPRTPATSWTRRPTTNWWAQPNLRSHAAAWARRPTSTAGRFIAAGDVGKFGYFDKFSLTAWIYPRGEGGKAAGGTILSRMTDEAEADGYYLRLVDGRLQVNLVKRWLDDAIRVETETAAGRRTAGITWR